MTLFTAKANGNWSDPGTWDTMGIPGTTINQDDIIDLKGFTITIDTSITANGTITGNGDGNITIASGNYFIPGQKTYIWKTPGNEIIAPEKKYNKIMTDKPIVEEVIFAAMGKEKTYYLDF